MQKIKNKQIFKKANAPLQQTVVPARSLEKFFLKCHLRVFVSFQDSLKLVAGNLFEISHFQSHLYKI